MGRNDDFFHGVNVDETEKRLFQTRDKDAKAYWQILPYLRGIIIQTIGKKEMCMNIRKALSDDIDAVTMIYDKIHTAEEAGEVVIGWERGIYPERRTALAALERDDLFVIEEGHTVVGTGILNQIQVDVYARGNWQYDADPSEVMVMHTLVIDPDLKGRGYGTAFALFYEDYARLNGCRYLRIDTNEKNIAARRLYNHLGYKEIGIINCVFNGLKDINLVLIEKKI